MGEDGTRLDISTFLLSSIHDMKNSMGVMAAYLQDALALDNRRAGRPTENGAREKTTQALYEAQRVTDHLIQLLAIYKIDQAFYPFDPQDHALTDLAREAMARVADLAEIKRIELDCDCGTTLYGWFDYELVFGVVVQALHNALRYARGRVMLRIQTHESGVRIRVEDDGPGYPDFLLAHGNGLNRGINHETGGTGLGLYFAGWWPACTRAPVEPEPSAWRTAAVWVAAVSCWNCPDHDATPCPFPNCRTCQPDLSDSSFLIIEDYEGMRGILRDHADQAPAPPASASRSTARPPWPCWNGTATTPSCATCTWARA
jgi:two-component system sensor histidine kinase SenX3